jgi:hypothetical protein
MDVEGGCQNSTRVPLSILPFYPHAKLGEAPSSRLALPGQCLCLLFLSLCHGKICLPHARKACAGRLDGEGVHGRKMAKAGLAKDEGTYVKGEGLPQRNTHSHASLAHHTSPQQAVEQQKEATERSRSRNGAYLGRDVLCRTDYH